MAVANYQGDGIYFFSFELDLIGNYTLYFTANGTIVDVYEMNVVPGMPSPQTTTVTGPGLDEVATAFAFTSVTVTVRDQYNNVVSEGGLSVTLGISNPLSKPYLLEPVVDFNNGSYLYEYVLQYGGLWFLEVNSYFLQGRVVGCGGCVTLMYSSWSAAAVGCGGGESAGTFSPA